MDIVFYNVHGGYCRVHPGSKAKNDAKVTFFGGASQPAVGSNARHMWDNPYTLGQAYDLRLASLVPQIGRIGKERLFQLSHRPGGRAADGSHCQR